MSENAQMILKYIEDSMYLYSYAPSLREIAQDLDLALSTVHKWVVWLEKNEYIARKPHTARTILLLQ